MSKVLMKGNEAIGEAAVIAGCRYFFGYPITPQSELPHYMVKRLPQVGGVFLQAESEVSAINMVYGSAGCGARVMTSSSSPGLSLKLEGISYIAASELPCVIVNIVRGGPGLGSIQPAQSDYFQATKGGGHGDYRMVVYAPSSVQEIVDLTIKAFNVADDYRNPVMILGDGLLGQMMEPVTLPEMVTYSPDKPWATMGMKDGKRNVINSLHIVPEENAEFNVHLQTKYQQMTDKEIMFEDYRVDDAEYVVVAYGSSARVAKGAVDKAREQGLKVGLIRPITLWPFPEQHINQVAQRVKAFLCVEMSMGQMVEDVRLAVNGQKPVEFYGVAGGMVPTVNDVVKQLEEIARREA